jgi:predicted signal transduction protein with EAL and GGDEF domain
MSKPEKVFKMGAVRASVFRNVIEKDGKLVPLAKVVIEVRYRDKAGQWQGTNSLSVNDLPKAIAALQQAYEYVLREGRDSAKHQPVDGGGHFRSAATLDG